MCRFRFSNRLLRKSRQSLKNSIEIDSTVLSDFFSKSASRVLNGSKSMEVLGVSKSINYPEDPNFTVFDPEIFSLFPVIGRSSFFKFEAEFAVSFYICFKDFYNCLSPHAFKLLMLMFIDFDSFQVNEYPEFETIFFSIVLWFKN